MYKVCDPVMNIYIIVIQKHITNSNEQSMQYNCFNAISAS